MQLFVLTFRSMEFMMEFSFQWPGFIQGCIEGVFFASTEAGDKDLAESAVDELSPSAMQQICDECAAYQTEAAHLLAQLPAGYNLEMAGRDFWLTRSGRTGFWAKDELGFLAPALEEIAATYPCQTLHLGDDGMLYLA
jgi:hypothetical protein